MNTKNKQIVSTANLVVKLYHNSEPQKLNILKKSEETTCGHNQYT